MNYALNENVKVLEKTLDGSNSDAVKTKLGDLIYFKMTLPLLQVFSSVTFSRTIESITNDSVG